MKTMIKSIGNYKNSAGMGNVLDYMKRTCWSELRYDYLGGEASGSSPEPSSVIVVGSYLFL